VTERLVVRTRSDRCRECQACALACSLYHDGACGLSAARLAVTKDMARFTFDITICRHCPSPVCVDACPVDAISVDLHGVVRIDEDECVRCGACASGCPFGAIFYDALGDRYLTCDLCAGRDGGPLCVEICPASALELVCVDDESQESV